MRSSALPLRPRLARIPALLPLLLLPYLIAPLWAPQAAAQFMTTPFPNVAHSADLIFVGTVAEQTSRLNDQKTMVFTDVFFEDVRVIHATRAAPQAKAERIRLTVPGGEIDGAQSALTETPHFVDKRRYVLFVKDDGNVYLNPVVGGPQGFFHVIEEDAQPVVLSIDGRAVVDVDTSGVVLGRRWLPPRTGPGPPVNVFAQAPRSLVPGDTAAHAWLWTPPVDLRPPLPLDAFIDRIEAVLQTPLPPRRESAFEPGFFYRREGDKLIKEPLPRARMVMPDTLLGAASPAASEVPIVRTRLGPRRQEVIPFAVNSRIYPCGSYASRIAIKATPSTFPTRYIDDESLSLWNRFVDIFRPSTGNGEAGWPNGENEFAGAQPSSVTNDIWGFRWSDFNRVTPGAAPTYPRNCLSIDETDILLNSALAWTDDLQTALNDPTVIYYRPVIMHELGHVIGLMRGREDDFSGFRETYSYDHPTVMQGNNSLLEDGYGLHAVDVQLLRVLYGQRFAPSDIIDVGVEAYFAQGGYQLAAAVDLGTINPIQAQDFVWAGDRMDILGVTLENMSAVDVSDMRLRFFLSRDRATGSPDDIQLRIPGSQSDFAFGLEHMEAEAFTPPLGFAVEVPDDTPPGRYFIEARLTLGSSSLDDYPQNNTAVLAFPITVRTVLMDGFVRDGSQGVEGVTMLGLPRQMTTDDAGYYFAFLPRGWSGTVQPSRALFTFVPGSRAYASLTSDQFNQDYAATPDAAEIKGIVWLGPDSTRIQGVRLEGGPQEAVTNDLGVYEAVVPQNWSGQLTPVKAGYRFEPPSRSYTDLTRSQYFQDYEAIPTQLFTDASIDLPVRLAPAMDWGDFDADGDLDLALTGRPPGFSQTGLTTIYRNDGRNRLTDIAPFDPGYLVGIDQGAVAWGDVDRDGDLDLLLSGDSDAGPITTIYQNDGPSTANTWWDFSDLFAGQPSPLEGVRDSAVAWGDYDNDGDLDIALSGFVDNSAWITRLYRNDSVPARDEWVFTDVFEDQPSPFLGVKSGTLAWADYDRDGDLDLLMAGGSRTADLVLHLYRNDGSSDEAWTFTTLEIAPPVDGQLRVGESAAWGDFDHDGDLDILHASHSGTTLYEQRDTDTFVATTTLPGTQSEGAAYPGDLNNDGTLDVLLLGTEGTDIYLNLNGSFPLHQRLPSVRRGAAALGDMDEDGRLDILLAGLGPEDELTRLYRGHAPTPNTVPTTPTALTLTRRGSQIVFAWDSASDAEGAPLTYNLGVTFRTSGPRTHTLTAMAADDGHRHIVAYGNTSASLQWPLTRRGTGTFCGRVQAIDATFAGSAFSEEACALIFPHQTLTPDDPSTTFDGTYGSRVTVEVPDVRDRIDVDAFQGHLPQIDPLPDGYSPVEAGYWHLSAEGEGPVRADLSFLVSWLAEAVSPSSLRVLHRATPNDVWQPTEATLTRTPEGWTQLLLKAQRLPGEYIIVREETRAPLVLLWLLIAVVLFIVFWLAWPRPAARVPG